MPSSETVALFDRVLSPGGRSLGTKLISYDPAARLVRLSFEAKAEFTNILGSIHGGYVAAMLDEAAGMAAKLGIAEDKAVPTLDFHTTFFAPSPVGTLFGEGKVTRMGRRTAFLEASLFDGGEKLLARMLVTAAVIDIPA